MNDRDDLERLAKKAMIDRGLLAEFAQPALEQLSRIQGPAPVPAKTGTSDGEVRDQRALLWCSVDNDDSKDLDQLSVGEDLGGGRVRIRVAIADVDVLVARDTPIDDHAAANTTSVYTPAVIFPMLPPRLSTDLTSLNPGQDRLAMVLEYVVEGDGKLGESSIYRAAVHNHAKLAYNAVAAWLDGEGPMPAAMAKVKGLDEQLRLQEGVAQRLRTLRHASGALDFQSIEARPVFEDGKVVSLVAEKPNRAKRMIEEFMIAANGVSARFLDARNSPSLSRVVKSPERWVKIVAVAAELGEKLPAEPSSKALELFLAKRRAADPERFPDLSLVIVKLMGRGEYVVSVPGEDDVGHFGLAVRDYSHTTAPNRRFPDLVTHRLLKAAMTKATPPYAVGDLAAIAQRCSEAEKAAEKVERQVKKSASALLLQRRLGEEFDGVITGAADKGTFVRVFSPPVEGRVVKGEKQLRVGDKVRVKLVATDFEKGFLDFTRA